MTDRDKLIGLAILLGDKPVETPKMLKIWGKVFTCNEEGEIVRISKLVRSKNGGYYSQILGRS